MKKTYVLDTNVLLHAPQAILSFGENNVVIPEVVLEELDKFKKQKSDLGFNARQSARLIDDLRKIGKLNEGVELPTGGTLKVELNYYDKSLPANWDKNKADNRIIQVCKGLKDSGEDVYLITKDIFERIKGDIFDIQSEDYYEKELPDFHNLYEGRREVYTDSEELENFYKNNKIDNSKITIYNGEADRYEIPKLYINEFVVIYSLQNPKNSAIGKFNGKEIVPLAYKDYSLFGIRARNLGQRFMTEALMLNASTAPLVIIKGPAGTAKTLFSLAAGLENVLESNEKRYRKILVCRPNITMDEDIGHLPGTEGEKIAPFMRPIIDNLEVLVDSDEKERYKSEKELGDKITELFQRKVVTTEAVAYLRGRSIVSNWIIIDEAQNLSPKQAKAIITRVGKGTKLVLVGDPEQIDNPFLDSRSNGLCYASEKMKGSPLCYQVTLKYDECERSPLAFEASKRL